MNLTTVFISSLNMKSVIICLYVDYTLIFGTDLEELEKTKWFLSSKFSIKDIGEADVILGIRSLKIMMVYAYLNLTILRKCLGGSIIKIAPQWPHLLIQPIS